MNEITAALLMKELDIAGAVVTGDAIPAQGSVSGAARPEDVLEIRRGHCGVENRPFRPKAGRRAASGTLPSMRTGAA